jgi:hypothetical protein
MRKIHDMTLLLSLMKGCPLAGRSSPSLVARDPGVLGVQSPLVNQPEAKDSRHDQKEGDDVVEQSRHHENEDAGDEGNYGLKVGDADVHGHALLLRCLKKARTMEAIALFI